jgi:serine/threonine-protein kinase
MSLASGVRLGAYEIIGSLGAGGMGEVYRARDTRLGRSVAIKILPEAFAADADRVARFEREAKVLASLNHPHIAALYGMEQGPSPGPAHFLIMELVEGETLCERLQRGPVPIDDALAIAIQIADALESAHEQGVVHRDLKPANVKLTPDDKVKVLDFGLAKAMDSSPAASSPANSPTLSVLATQAGLIMGTAAYMSPEQAKGAATDRRSDGFAFGVVLYELLSGRQPFRGDTAAEVMASVMIRDADLTSLPAGLNPRIAEVIRRCLEKNPKKRWQSMGDLRAELETLAKAPLQTAPSDSGVGLAVKPLWQRTLPIVLAVAITAIAVTLITRSLTPVAERDIVRFAIASPNYVNAFQSLSWSPDGSRLVYVTGVGPGSRQLMLRTMADAEARPIGGGEGLLNNVDFSPDGQSVAFFSNVDQMVKKIAVSGGSAVALCKAVTPVSGLSWSDGAIFFGQPDGIHRVSENGGDSQVVVPLKQGERISSPQLIDRRGSILFGLSSDPSWEQANVMVQAPDGTRHVVVSGGTSARLLTSGHLVYAAGATLLAVPFDITTLRVVGGPTPVVKAVARASTQAWASHFAVSNSGSLAYRPGVDVLSARRMLALVDLAGKVQVTLPGPPQSYFHPRASPDGSQVAVATVDAKEAAIVIIDLANAGSPRRLTFEGRNMAPIWTPDGRFITFQSDRGGARGLFHQRADGSGAAEQLTKAEPGEDHFPDSWSPDGKILSFRVTVNFVSSVWTLSRDGDRTPVRLLSGERSYASSAFSPDGRWLAYGTNEINGRAYQVFVQPFPSTGAKYQVSPITASTPLWFPDGRRMLMAYNKQVFGVDLRFAPTFSSSQPVELSLPDILESQAVIRDFDLMPDGKRLLVILPEGMAGRPTAPPSEINVVLNWFNELKRSVPIR